MTNTDSFGLPGEDPPYSPKPITIVLPPGQEVRIVSGAELKVVIGETAEMPARRGEPDWPPPLTPTPKPDSKPPRRAKARARKSPAKGQPPRKA